MALCRPCRHDDHDACKKGAYKTAGCTCTTCGPHPNPALKAAT